MTEHVSTIANKIRVLKGGRSRVLHRASCNCGWGDTSRVRLDTAMANADDHKRRNSGPGCGACGNPAGLHPLRGTCARYEIPGQLVFQLRKPSA